MTTAHDDSTAVGFIGLGQIGRPMAARLAGWPAGLWVHDVDPSATAALEQAGAKVAGRPREVAEHAGHVSVMVRDDAQVHDVLTGVDGVLAGARAGCVIAVHSTIHPDTAREVAELAAARGVRVLDAPVSGGAVGAQQGRLAILVGGDPDAYEASREVLDRMGELVVHVGPVGAGTAAKLARNLLHFVAFTAATEASRLAEAAGIDLVALGKVVRHTDAITGGPGAIMWRDTTAPIATDDNWFAILEHVRQLGEKDLALAAELGDRLGVDTPLADLALRRLAPGLGLCAPETP
jgi:3-hydroxyisobutyrate dehydrogenase-like beta-hydroxyacid dehydrogenase